MRNWLVRVLCYVKNYLDKKLSNENGDSHVIRGKEELLLYDDVKHSTVLNGLKGMNELNYSSKNDLTIKDVNKDKLVYLLEKKVRKRKVNLMNMDNYLRYIELKYEVDFLLKECGVSVTKNDGRYDLLLKELKEKQYILEKLKNDIYMD